MYNKVNAEDIKVFQNIVGEEDVITGNAINPDYAHDELGGIEKMPEVLVKVTDETKFEIVSNVRDIYINKGIEVIAVDGARVIFEDGWGLIRASNTGPNLSIKAEATSIERAEEILSEIKSCIEKCAK